MDKKKLSILLMGMYIIGFYPVYTLTRDKETVVHATTMKEPIKSNNLNVRNESDKLKILYDLNYPLEERLKLYLDDNLEKVGLIYYDFTSGTKISINENEEFIAASTYKVGLNLLAYYNANMGTLDLNEKIQYKDEYFEGGTGVLQKK